jgi:MFS superfamily sulfate permease-like transporter
VQTSHNATTARNLFVCAGAYYLSAWLSLPLSLAFAKLTQGLIYHGDFGIAVLQPMVLHLPSAVVAVIAGAAIVWLVESKRPTGWAIITAFLYLVLGFLGYHWGRAPVFLDRAAQTVGAAFPALACVVGAVMTKARKNRSTGRDISDA